MLINLTNAITEKLSGAMHNLDLAAIQFTAAELHLDSIEDINNPDPKHVISAFQCIREGNKLLDKVK